MVYCGKPSKGCSNCRERKIRVSVLVSACNEWLLPESVNNANIQSNSAISGSLAAASARSGAKNVQAIGT